LRLGGRWERLVEIDPSDEQAYRELMRVTLATGKLTEHWGHGSARITKRRSDPPAEVQDAAGPDVVE